jgi:hypothetical protein
MRLSAQGGVAPPKRGTLIHIFEMRSSKQRTEFRYQKLADFRKEKAMSPSENQRPVDNQNNINVQAQALLF